MQRTTYVEGARALRPQAARRRRLAVYGASVVCSVVGIIDGSVLGAAGRAVAHQHLRRRTRACFDARDAGLAAGLPPSYFARPCSIVITTAGSPPAACGDLSRRLLAFTARKATALSWTSRDRGLCACLRLRPALGSATGARRPSRGSVGRPVADALRSPARCSSRARARPRSRRYRAWVWPIRRVSPAAGWSPGRRRSPRVGLDAGTVRRRASWLRSARRARLGASRRRRRATVAVAAAVPPGRSWCRALIASPRRGRRARADAAGARGGVAAGAPRPRRRQRRGERGTAPSAGWERARRRRTTWCASAARRDAAARLDRRPGPAFARAACCTPTSLPRSLADAGAPLEGRGHPGVGRRIRADGGPRWPAGPSVTNTVVDPAAGPTSRRRPSSPPSARWRSPSATSLSSVFLNILAAIDGSEHGAAALRTAAQLARDEHARLTIVTAVPPAPAVAALSAAAALR